MLGPSLSLRPWQQEFASNYLRHPGRKSLLLAPTGAGKTLTSLHTAREMIRRELADRTLVLTDRAVLREQWVRAAHQMDLKLVQSVEEARAGEGLSLTVQTLMLPERRARMDDLAKERRWFIIADDLRTLDGFAPSVINALLSMNEESRALFLTSTLPPATTFDAEFRFDSQHVVTRSLIERPDTEIRLARFSPSFQLLRKLQRNAIQMDDLSWREFEKLVAELLQRDGYEVTLMQGSRDGGVDVVATRDLGASGYFKAVWQAKKQRSGNKVGISVIRELADTRQELGASKGIIVTSSYLTSGALSRVERDNYRLGKVDRDDLQQWINRTLMA